MSNRGQIAACVVVCVLMVAAAIWVPQVMERRRQARANDAALGRMADYCARVRDALEQDAMDLASSDPQRTVIASARFGGRRALHAWTDLGLCAAEFPEIDKTSCSGDTTCLSRLAQLAASAIVDPLESSEKSQTLRRLENHCRRVQLELDFADTQLSSEDATDRDEWLDFFANGYALGSIPEIQMCAPEPPDLHVDGCRRAKDYACVARVALAAEHAIYLPTN